MMRRRGRGALTVALLYQVSHGRCACRKNHIAGFVPSAPAIAIRRSLEDVGGQWTGRRDRRSSNAGIDRMLLVLHGGNDAVLGQDAMLNPLNEDRLRASSLDDVTRNLYMEDLEDPEILTLVDLVKLLHKSEDPVWDLIRLEGRIATKQSRVSSNLHGSVLARESLEDAVASDISNKMATTFLGASELNLLMGDMFEECPGISAVVSQDLLATAMRDNSVPDILTILLFHKGFHALSTYRLAHWLWVEGRKSLARYLQSVTSEVCAADIHPACEIGRGVHLASGCDIVIGETAVVGNDVCLLQGVTLGGTGKNSGDRHPKVANGVHIGAGCSVLGNIPVGEGARVEAATVVVKPVAPYTVSRGVPAKMIGFIVCDPFSLGNRSTTFPRRIFINYQSL